MYSVVVMMALTSGGEVADFGHRHGCHGGRMSSCGCCGGGGWSCHGGGWSCHGGGGWSCHGGGWSSCYGGGGWSCHGGGWSSCYGGGGCWGSSSWGGCYGGGGCWGSASSGGCYGGYAVSTPVYGAPVTPSTPDGGKKMSSGEEEKAQSEAPATIVVSLPADARLTIDDSLTTATSARRVFVSPALEPGKTYHYTLKAEVTRDGKPVHMEERVAVQAGRETQVTLSLPAAGVAQR